MDLTTTSTMDNKKPAPRLAQQSSKLHAQDHKDANSKKSSGGRRRQHEWERDGAPGHGGGGRVKVSNGGAGASAGRGGWGRSANRAARNKEKEGGQIGGHRGDWSHDYVDVDDFFSYNAPHRGGNAKQPCNITQNFLSWWQPSSQGTRRGPNSNWKGAGGRQSVGGEGRRNGQYSHGGGTGATKMTNSKARFLQARCQFVMNPCKEAQHVASARVPVGVSLAAPTAYKTGPGTAPSNLVGAPSLADHQYHQQPLIPQQTPVESTESEENDDPDALVPWHAVEEVLVHMTQPTHCPVCLYPPVAPQVTKCGHIYCYPCILHYLALSDKKWRACPICYEMVVRDDLKSAVCIVHPDYSVGSTISMVLMRRQRHSMQPSAVRPPHDYSPHSLARKISATRAKVLSITDREQSALEVQLAAEGAEPEACFIEEALTLVKERQQVLKVAYPEQDDPQVSETMFDEQSLAGSTGVGTGTRLTPKKSVTDTDSTKGFMPRDVSDRSSHKADETTEAALRLADASQNSYRSSESDKTETLSSPLAIPWSVMNTPLEGCASLTDPSLESYLLHCNRSESSSASSSLSEGVLYMDEEFCTEEESSSLVESLEMLNLEDVREVDRRNLQPDKDESVAGSECLNFDLEGEVVDNKKTVMFASSEHAVHSARVVAPQNTSNNAPKSTYYFYQASDGSHVYLHALNMAMLRNQYESEESCPATVTATIVEKDYFLMDEDLRNRFKALRHLPLCCAFETVELNLQSPLVSPETIAVFQKRLSGRQQLRNSRAKEENLIERRNLELEEKELSSRLFTRVYSATSSTVGTGTRPRSSVSASSDGGSGLMDFADIASGDLGRLASSDGSSSPELATSPPARTPQQQQPSFAKMLRVHPNNAGSEGTGAGGVAWPSLGRHNPISVGGARTKAAGPGAWGSSSSPQSASSAYGSSDRKSLASCAAPDPFDDDALFNVPDYSQTFSQGFDLSLQVAEAAAAAARQTGAEGKRGKKGRKKTKQVLLFSSGL